MFLLNGNPLAVDTAFTNDGIQYPANWLRLASAEEKASIGITEVADTVRADDRFYWNGDINNPKALEDVLATKEDGSPLMVQVYNPVTEAMEDTSKQVVTKGLKSAQVAQIKSSAGFLLASTDWYVVRKADIGTDIPEDVATYRSAVRAEADRVETQILAVTTVDALMAIEPNWPTL
jgi:hypothetical protein